MGTPRIFGPLPSQVVPRIEHAHGKLGRHWHVVSESLRMSTVSELMEAQGFEARRFEDLDPKTQERIRRAVKQFDFSPERLAWVTPTSSYYAGKPEGKQP